MKYETAKKYAIRDHHVMVHTNAFERAIYLGRVEELTLDCLELNPAESQSWIGNSPTSPRNIKEMSLGIPILIDLESIIAIGKMPSSKEIK